MQCAIVSRFVEGRKIMQKVASGQQIGCNNTTCDSLAAEATVFCHDCWLFYCSFCLKSNRTLEGIIGKHNVKSIETIRSGTAEGKVDLLRKAVPLSCPRHKGEVFKYCCVSCDALMCQACRVDKDYPHRPAYLRVD